MIIVTVITGNSRKVLSIYLRKIPFISYRWLKQNDVFQRNICIIYTI